MSDSKPHSEQVRRITKALHEASYANTEDGLTALGELVEQLEAARTTAIVEAQQHEELKEQYGELQRWAHQVHDALDGRPIEHPDEGPARIIGLLEQNEFHKGEVALLSEMIDGLKEQKEAADRRDDWLAKQLDGIIQDAEAHFRTIGSGSEASAEGRWSAAFLGNLRDARAALNPASGSGHTPLSGEMQEAALAPASAHRSPDSSPATTSSEGQGNQQQSHPLTSGPDLAAPLPGPEASSPAKRPT